MTAKSMLNTEHPDSLQPISLIDLWNTICRRKIFVALTIAAFLFAGLTYYVFAPRYYTARAVVMLENQKRDVQIKSVLTSDTNDLMLIPSEIQVLMSQNLIGKVVDKLGLTENKTLLTSHPDTKAVKIGMTAKAKDAARIEIIFCILKNLKVKQVERSRALGVTYDGRNPEISAAIVNTLTELYIEQQLSSNLDAVRMTNNWLSGRVQETQAKLHEADLKVAQYREKAGIVDSRGIDLIEQNISDLSNKLTDANAQVASTQARLSQIGDIKTLDSAPEVLSAPLIQKLREREAEARDELAALQNQLGPDHPKVKTARAQVMEINAKIRQEISKLAEGLKLEHRTAVDNAANIQKQLNELKVDYNRYKNDNVGLNALEAEATTYRNFLDTLNLRFKETQSQDDNKFQAPYARIITKAVVPDSPSSPKGKLIIAAALLLGFISGAGAALTHDMIQHGIYNGSQIQRITGKTNIAVIPKENLDPDKNIIGYANLPLQSPLSPYVQGIRALSMFIRLEINKNPSRKIFNFTSAVAGEGKSAIVIATARQLAMEGLKVLAIDCDIRQPALSHTFGIMHKPGLAEILKGKADLSNVIFCDAETGAVFLGIGGMNNINVMSQDLDTWTKLLDSISSGFDMVLLDSPPVISSPESRLLSKVSQNIVCVRWRKPRSNF